LDGAYCCGSPEAHPAIIASAASADHQGILFGGTWFEIFPQARPEGLSVEID